MRVYIHLRGVNTEYIELHLLVDVCVCLFGVAFVSCLYCCMHRRVFYSFLHALCCTFADCPTVYHLGALRSLQGIFSNAQEVCVRRAVAAALEGCVGATLSKIKVSRYAQQRGLSPLPHLTQRDALL